MMPVFSMVFRMVFRVQGGLARLLMGSLLMVSTTAWAVLPVYVNHLGMAFVQIPAGHFYMGACRFIPGQQSTAESCPSGAGTDPDAYADETPQHGVNVRGFQMAVTPVTLGQFRRYALASGQTQLLSADFLLANEGQGEATPVVHVSWDDAQAFIHWLNQSKPASDRGQYRLPSEAEWEYAARAGSRTRYFFGEGATEQLALHAWYDKNAGNRQRVVGSRRANAWGLQDILGNVWEWTQDCWHENYQSAPVDGRAWEIEAEGECSRRVVRGGSWFDVSMYLRVTSRFGDRASRRINYDGFRVVRSLD